MKIIVIGGGPAGMMAAITAAENGNHVILLEKKERLGRKLLITGKGRCNITSNLPMEEFIPNIPGNGKFLYRAFQNYTNQDLLEFLKKAGVATKVERGNRVFPVSDRSIDVLEAFTKKLKELNVKVETKAEVKEILVEQEKAVGVCYCHTETNQEFEVKADKIILATGGKSYPDTGSTGDGYRMAEALGHHIIPPKPSLVPMLANTKEGQEDEKIKASRYRNSLALCQAMQGLNLRNVQIQIKDFEKKKTIYEDFGEMLFAHFGVSGPTILSGSSYIRRYPQIEEKLAQGKIRLEIDLKPALTEEQLDARIQRDFANLPKKQFHNSLDELLPRKLIEPVIALSGIMPEKKVCEISKKERMNLVQTCKKFPILLASFGNIQDAIITAGGVDVKEINPKTMESKQISGLYFAGEIMDVDAYTGGFNLQIAYSTGVTAGKNKEEEDLECTKQ